MLSRAMFWLVIGLALGLLAAAARLPLARWSNRRWLAAPAFGAIVALVGGGLGSLIFDDIFATYAAIWLSVAAFGVVALLDKWRAIGG